MKNRIYTLTFLFLASFSLFLISCRDKENISIVTNFDKLDDQNLHLGDKLPLEFSTADATIDSYTIKLNDKVYENEKNIVLDSTNAKMGVNYFVVTINYNKQYKKDIDATFTIFSLEKEKNMSYKIIQEYPHNPELFTQGFSYKNGIITESSGQYEKSQLVRYTLGSTTYTQSVKIAPEIFAEGFALLNGKLYLLSWKERKGFVYNESDLKLIKEFPYPGSIFEGWGATTIGNEIVVSDSSTDLKFFDENLNLKKTITVIGYDRTYPFVNEMEYANGYIYANIYGQPIILVINPKTGAVVAKADFTDLVKENQHDEESVLNGIAHVEGNTFLITGKLWSKIYKVELNF